MFHSYLCKVASYPLFSSQGVHSYVSASHFDLSAVATEKQSVFAALCSAGTSVPCAVPARRLQRATELCAWGTAKLRMQMRVLLMIHAMFSHPKHFLFFFSRMPFVLVFSLVLFCFCFVFFLEKWTFKWLVSATFYTPECASFITYTQ